MMKMDMFLELQKLLPGREIVLREELTSGIQKKTNGFPEVQESQDTILL